MTDYDSPWKHVLERYFPDFLAFFFPEALLLDEPTNGLDEATEQRLVEHLSGLDQAMIIVSHDRRFLERLATRAVRLADGTLTDATLHSHDHIHRHAHLHLHAPGVGAEHSHDPAPDHHCH